MSGRNTSMFLALAVVGAAFGENVVPDYGDVRLKGPIGERMDRMIRNHVAATDVDYITEPFASRSERTGKWQTEFWGKWMHSACPYARYADSDALRKLVDRGVDAILAAQEPGGYIGNYPDELRCGDGWDVWGMKYTLMGLMHYYDATRSRSKAEAEKGDRALAAARRLCDYVIRELGPNGRRGVALWQTGSWAGLASSSILEPVVWLYRRTGEKRYLDFATYVVKGMTEAKNGPRLVDLALRHVSPVDRTDGDGKKVSRRKAYEMISCYQGLLDYAEEMEKVESKDGGDAKNGGWKDLRAAAIATAEVVLRDEINLAGGAASGELWYRGATRQHLPYWHMQETCVTTTWMRFLEKLATITGEVRWVDALEKSFYNAYLAAMRADGAEFAAYTPLSGSRWSGHHHCYMHTNCCTANGPRGFLCFLRTALQASGSTAFLNLYASGDMKVKLPATGREVALGVYTEYPRLGNVRIVNRTADGTAFTLALRVPAWSEKTVVKVNGRELETPVAPGAYCGLTRTWKKGDVVEFDFDLVVKMHTLDHAVAFTRGPILLARDARFGDGPIDEVLPYRWRSDGPMPVPDMQLARIPDRRFWMTFTANLRLGSHQENPDARTPATVRFCDYASAGDAWCPGDAYRTWFPVEYGVDE